MEELLLGIVPGLAEQWQGATPDEIARIEQLAGRPLPPFYRWFLTRMGHGMGPLAYPTLDFSAQRVIACYEEQLVMPHPRFLLIGHESDELMPLHLFYDLDAPARADARVMSRDARGGPLYDGFDTFREMLAWGALLLFRIEKMPQRCEGTLNGGHPEVLSDVDPLMSSLGFTRSIPTGRFCGLYERSDAVMIFHSNPWSGSAGIQTFILAGGDAGALRRILGAFATQPSLEIEVKQWEPALP